MIQGRSDDHGYFYQNNKNNNCDHTKKPQHQPSEIFVHFFLLLKKLIIFSNPLIKKNTINAEIAAHITIKIIKKIKICVMISKITPPFIC